jgi:hypothetical protein
VSESQPPEGRSPEGHPPEGLPPSPEPPAVTEPQPEPRPVRLAINDDLKRSRLTVFLRLLLALPHFFWQWVWALVIFVCAVVNWFATLIVGRSPEDLHLLLARALRYRTHFLSYVALVSNPYPRFFGRLGSHPVDLEIDGPDRQRRVITLFRLILAIPAIVVAYVFLLVMFFVALIGWFVAIVIGRTPKGMRDLSAYCLQYEAQVSAYLLMLTDRYPSFAGPRS